MEELLASALLHIDVYNMVSSDKIREMKKLLICLSAMIVSGAFFIACRTMKNKGTLENGKENEGVTEDWRFGVASWSFHSFPFSVALAKTDSTAVRFMEVSAGYQMGGEFGDSLLIDLSTEGIQKVKAMLQARGIVMGSIYADGHDINAWKRNFGLARELGVKYITGEPAAQLLDGIDSMASIYRIPVAIHNHWKGLSRYWHPDSVILAMKGRPYIKACADLGHWARSGLNGAECLKKLAGHILGIHLKDIREFSNIKSEDVRVGTGVVNYNEVVSELKRQKFKGMIYAECEMNWGNNVPDIIASFRYFTALSKKIGN
jgi:sugar phosphate isomerase/epimerase